MPYAQSQPHAGTDCIWLDMQWMRTRKSLYKRTQVTLDTRVLTVNVYVTAEHTT